MNNSPLTCVFRVGGSDLDIDAILNGATIQPYRIDRSGIGRAKINALHYDVSAAEPITSSELGAAIEGFLIENKQDILFIRQMRGIEQFVLDVALIIDDEMAMRTLALNQPLLAVIADAGLSYEVSAYRGGPG